MSCGALASPDDLEASQAPPGPPVPAGTVMTIISQLCRSLHWRRRKDFPDLVAKVISSIYALQNDDVEMHLANSPRPSEDSNLSPQDLKLPEPQQDLGLADRGISDRPYPLAELTSKDTIRILHLSKGKDPDSMGCPSCIISSIFQSMKPYHTHGPPQVEM